MEPPPIDSPSPTPHKWVRRLGWTVLWLITIPFLAAALSGAYSKHRYQKALANAKAAGLPDSWDEVLPKPVPEVDNFGAIEDFKPFLAIEHVKVPPSSENPFGFKTRYLDETGMKPLKSIKPLKISGGSLKVLGPFEARSLADLRSKALSENRLAPDTTDLSDSDAILKVYENLDPLWKRLHEAKQRPHASVFPIAPARNPLLMANPLINPVLSIANVTQLRARAHVNAGRGTEALEECLLLLKVADLHAYPTLIEHLVHVTQLGLLMPALYEGVSRQVWSDPQLAILDQALARCDCMSSLEVSLGGESLFARDWQASVQAEPTLKKDVKLEMLLAVVGRDAKARSFSDQLLTFVFGKTILNIISTNSLDSITIYKKAVSAEGSRNLRAILPPPKPHWGPLNFLAESISLPIFGVIKTSFRGQTLVNIGRIAIALERHRLRHGSFPRTLETLVPGFLAAIPTEVFDGAPLHYLLKENAQGFTLYSTGWKGTDDGGAMDYSKPDQTNWTWSAP
jgi:hypothetical protein